MLEYFGRRMRHSGAHVIADDQDFPLFDAESPVEVDYYIRALEEQGALRQSGAHGRYFVTPQGWARLTPIEQAGYPTRAVWPSCASTRSSTTAS